MFEGFFNDHPWGAHVEGGLEVGQEVIWVDGVSEGLVGDCEDFGGDPVQGCGVEVLPGGEDLGCCVWASASPLGVSFLGDGDDMGPDVDVGEALVWEDEGVDEVGGPGEEGPEDVGEVFGDFGGCFAFT